MNDCTEIPLTGFLISHAYSVNFFAQSNFWSKLFWMDAISIRIDPKSFITALDYKADILAIAPLVRTVHCINNIYIRYLELSNIAYVAELICLF